MHRQSGRVLVQFNQLFKQPFVCARFGESITRKNYSTQASVSTSDHFDNLVSEFPQLARKERSITQNYKNIESVPTGALKVGGFGVSIDPTANFGKNVLNPAFRLTFTGDNGAVRIKYGSMLIAAGPKVELGIRAGFTFVTGNTEPVQSIPRALEVDAGWDIGILRYNLTKFTIRELPGLKFWGVHLNYGLAFGVQSINSGFLYYDHTNNSPTERLRQKGWNGIINKGLSYWVYVVIGLGVFTFFSTIPYLFASLSDTHKMESAHVYRLLAGVPMYSDKLGDDLYELYQQGKLAPGAASSNSN